MLEKLEQHQIENSSKILGGGIVIDGKPD